METEDRIVELQALLAAKDARIAEQDARIAEQDARIATQDARIATQDARITGLTVEIAALRRRLGEDSGNSNKPPSSDPPQNRAARRAKKAEKRNETKRKRGGQPGHKGASRKLLPPDRVDEVKDLFPEECENCWESLPPVVDKRPRRYQQIDLGSFGPAVTEWRLHSVKCCSCGHRTCAKYDADVIPRSAFGPRLVATVALLTGAYHLSRRQTVDLMRELLGVELSLGSVSNLEARASGAVRPAVDEAWEQVRRDAVKHTDGTSWYQAGVMKSLWTVATTMATVFTVLADGKGATLKPLFGALLGILVSDRATALKFWAMDRRQICWAHLLRKFISFSERDGPAGVYGRELSDYVGVIFANWNELKDGKLTRSQFQERMKPVRAQFEAALERAVAAKIREISGSCNDMLEHRAALWTFVDNVGVEPTNNHAEQVLRAFVLWRKRSFGTQSDRGNDFAARVMTVVETARKQKRNVLEFLTACCIAQRDRTAAPSLFAA